MKNRTDRLLLGAIFLLLVTFAVVTAESLNDHVTKEGDAAPSFSVTTDSGRKLTPSQFGGKLLVLNFWATWCQPCVDEIPALDTLQRQFAGQGLVVLGLSIDNDAAAYRKFLDKNRVSFETARETADKINVDYGTLKVPETYIIDRSGKVLKKVVGEERWSDPAVLSYVQSLL